MRSVEDMLLQLILQGDSFTYRCAAFRHHVAPHRAAPCCTHHHYAGPHYHAAHIILLHLVLHLSVLQHLALPYHLAALTSAASYYTSLYCIMYHCCPQCFKTSTPTSTRPRVDSDSDSDSNSVSTRSARFQ